MSEEASSNPGAWFGIRSSNAKKRLQDEQDLDRRWGSLGVIEMRNPGLKRRLEQIEAEVQSVVLGWRDVSGGPSHYGKRPGAVASRAVMERDGNLHKALHNATMRVIEGHRSPEVLEDLMSFEIMLRVDQVDALFKLGAFHLAIVAWPASLHGGGSQAEFRLSELTVCGLTVVGPPNLLRMRACLLGPLEELLRQIFVLAGHQAEPN